MSYRTIFRLVTLLASVLLHSQVAIVYAAPIDISGQIRANYSLYIPDEGDNRNEYGMTGTIGASSYIWRPWLATWSGQISGSQSKSDSGSDESETNTYSGHANLDLFPVSWFPASLYYRVLDTRTASISDVDELTLSEITAGKRETTYGYRQSYAVDQGNGMYTFHAEHNDDEDLSTDNTDTTDTITLRGRQRLNSRNTLRETLEYEEHSSDFNDLSDRLYNLSLGHTFNSKSNLSLINTMDYWDYKQESLLFTDSREKRFNANSDLSWYSRDGYLRVTGSARMERSELETELVDEAQKEGSEFYRSNINYDIARDRKFDQRISLNAFASGEASRRDGAGDRQSAALGMSAGFSESRIPIGEFNYNWGVSSALSGRYESDAESSTFTELTGNANHAIGRRWEIPSYNGAYDFSLRQDYNVGFAEGEMTEQQLFTNGGLSLFTNTNIGHTRATLQLVDSYIETFGETSSKSRFQTLSLDFNHEYVKSLSRFSVVKIFITSGVGIFVTDGDASEPSGHSEFEASYENRFPLRIQNARFISTYEYISDDYFSYNVFDDERYKASWQNRFSYRVGYLTMQARTLTQQQAGGVFNHALFLEAARSF